MVPRLVLPIKILMFVLTMGGIDGTLYLGQPLTEQGMEAEIASAAARRAPKWRFNEQRSQEAIS